MSGCALTGATGNPTVSSVAPQSVRAGSPSQAITATGTNFTLTSVVKVNGKPRSTTFISNTQLSAVLLSADLAQASTLKITVSDVGALGVTVSNSFSFSVAPSLLKVVTTSLPAGVAQANYASAVVALGGVSPYTWKISAGQLPSGLSLTATTGAITGVPSQTGQFSFTAAVTDPESTPQTASQAFNLAVTAAPVPLTMTSASIPNGITQVPYSAALGATGGSTPYAWSLASGTLPAGVTLNPATGVLSGTPTTKGTYSFTVQVRDSSPLVQSALATLSMMLVDPLQVATSSLPSGQVQLSYNTTLTPSGGMAPYAWSITSGTLPPGLSLNSSTGVLSGTPTTTGSYSFTVQVSDPPTIPQTASRTLAMTVAPPPLQVTTSSLAGGQVQSAYSATLAASGGTSPYTWSVAVGSLPAGLSLNASTGVISGTPTTAGSSSFTVQARDSATTAQTATNALSITVAPATLQVSTSSLAGGQAQSAYSATLAASGGTSPYTWSVTAGSLPAGLSLNASTGVISGTPTTAGSSSFTVQARDSATTAQTASQALSINVVPATLQVTTSSLASGQVQVAYGATLAASGGTTPYSWSVTVGSLPAGLSLNASTGLISGTPTTAGTSSFTVQARDSATTTQTAAKALSITIAPATLQVTTSSLASGQVQVAYSVTLAASGGTGPYTWGINAGVLPAGMSLNASTGVISGTPTTSGTASFTVQALDSATTAQTATKALSITVAPATLQVTTSSLPSGQVQSSYSGILAASGGTTPYTWSITVGSLPAGLGLNASTGSISGTPTTAGSFSFTARVTDGAATLQSASKQFAISVGTAVVPLSVTTPTLPGGITQTAYQGATLSATGGTAPYTWIVATGALPPGLNLSTSTGAISGTPTAIGTFNFTVQAMDSAASPQTATASASIMIVAPLLITTTSIPTPQLQVPYSFTLTFTGGMAPYTWSISSGSLPPGLSLGSSTGVISGTPTASGAYSFTVLLTDPPSIPQTDTQLLSTSVPPPALQITTTSLASGQVQSAYSAILSATGGTSPYTWSVAGGTLPAGLSLNSSTGVISGTPTAAGNSSFTVQASDAASTPQTANQALSVSVSPAALQVTTSSLAGGQVQVAYSATLAASGGTSPYSWSVTVSSLPAGLSLNALTGVISGTPTTAGTSSFTVQVRDSATTAQTATKALSITVAPATLQVTTSSLASGQVQVAYSATLAASGGTSPYTWSVTAGSLPAGLSLNASTGVLSGTPTASGTSSFTVQARDSATTAQTATKALSITVAPATLQVTTSSLASGQVQVAYSATLAASGGTAPYTWSITTGSLPTGLSLNASTGVISGTPTTAGTFGFVAQARDTVGLTASASLSMSIASTATAPPPSISSVSPNTGPTTGGTLVTITGANFQSGATVSFDTTPAQSVTFSSTTQLLAMTPAHAATFADVTVKNTDGQSTFIEGGFNYKSASTPQITTTGLPGGQVGTAYQATISASGGTTPYSWSVVGGSLPTGLSLAASTGQVSGTPSQSGSFSFTVKVTDATAQTAQSLLSVNIAAQTGGPLAISTSSLPTGVLNVSYSSTLQAGGGTPSYSWSVVSGQLPPGLSLMASSGQILGTPSASGQYSFTVRVQDSSSPAQAATAPLVLTISTVQFDQYGGLLGVTSPNGGTGRFRVEKMGNRWVNIDPLGHPFWALGVYNMDYDDRYVDITAKYGSGGRTTWALQAMKRMAAWGFNTPGEWSTSYVLPSTPGITQMPFTVLLKPALTSMRNDANLAPQAVKDLIEAQDRSIYSGGGSLVDVFDANWVPYVNAFVPSDQGLNNPAWGGLAQSDWSMGVSLDEIDELRGFGPGPEIPSTLRIHSHIGWYAISARPAFAGPSPSWGKTYSDTKVYSKFELQSELKAKYGTIGALNAAWGSNYTTWDSAGGYGVGTGWLDENGRHTAWLGPTDGTLIGVPAAVQTDLDAFLSSFARQYFSVVTGAIRAAAPNLVIYSPAGLNGWHGLTRKQVLQAAGQYCDALSAGGTALTQQQFDLTYQYAGDKPIMVYLAFTSNQDSPYNGNLGAGDGQDEFSTQALRGQHYTNVMNFMLNMQTTSGAVHTIIGMKWWDWFDSNPEGMNWGLVSEKDNAYDGHEAVIASGVDPWGYPTGGEAANYGDFITSVKTANRTAVRSLCTLLGGTACP